MHNEERAETSVEEDETVHSDCEIDEELLAFYEKTIRHKLERSMSSSLFYFLCYETKMKYCKCLILTALHYIILMVFYFYSYGFA